jgi:hypothetical protein
MAPYEGIIYPNDLEDLRANFLAICRARDIRPDSGEGEMIGKQLLALYEAGLYRDCDVLVAFGVRSAAPV